MAGIKVSVIHGDAFQIKADALVLKYAQASYGLDRDIEREYDRLGESITDKLPKVGGYLFLGSKKITSTKSIIFIGVTTLRQFGYKEIREFGRKALVSLASSDPNIQSILMTIHGPGYGLDEIEAFESQLAGILDSISSDDFPNKLSEIIFVERSQGSANRLSSVLKGLFPTFEIPTQKSGGVYVQEAFLQKISASDVGRLLLPPLLVFVYSNSRQASPTTYLQEAFAYRYVGYIL